MKNGKETKMGASISSLFAPLQSQLRTKENVSHFPAGVARKALSFLIEPYPQVFFKRQFTKKIPNGNSLIDIFVRQCVCP